MANGKTNGEKLRNSTIVKAHIQCNGKKKNHTNDPMVKTIETTQSDQF